MKGKIRILGNLKEAEVNKETKVIKHISLLSAVSKNKRKYLDAALNQSVSLLEGIKSYYNHQEKNKRGETRDVGDFIGIYKNVLREGNTVFGDLHLVGDDSPEEKKILAIAENMPEAAGNSIVARGRYRREDGWDLIEEFTKMNSVDIVTDPATTSSLFESIEEIKEEEEDKMDLSKLTQAELKTARPDIYETIIKEGAASRDDEVKKLTEDGSKLKLKVDEFEVKEKVSKKHEKVVKILKESKISADLVTDVFMESLDAIPGEDEKVHEETIKRLVEDRKKFSKSTGVKNFGESEEDKGEEGDKKTSDADFDEAVTEDD